MCLHFFPFDSLLFANCSWTKFPFYCDYMKSDLRRAKARAHSIKFFASKTDKSHFHGNNVVQSVRSHLHTQTENDGINFAHTFLDLQQ